MFPHWASHNQTWCVYSLKSTSVYKVWYCDFDCWLLSSLCCQLWCDVCSLVYVGCVHNWLWSKTFELRVLAIHVCVQNKHIYVHDSVCNKLNWRLDTCMKFSRFIFYYPCSGKRNPSKRQSHLGWRCIATLYIIRQPLFLVNYCNGVVTQCIASLVYSLTVEHVLVRGSGTYNHVN